VLGLNFGLTHHNEVTYDPPIYSMSFDGTNDYISFTETSFAIYDNGEDLSISFWAKRTDNNDEAVVLGNSAVGSYKRMYFDSDGNRLDIESDQNGQLAHAAVTQDTNWHHYVIAADGRGASTASSVVMYEDGSALTTTHGNFGVSEGKDFTVNRIGADTNTDGTKEFKGLLYQVAIWTGRTLNATQVAEIYNGGNPTSLLSKTYQPSHLWRFDEGSGSTTADSVGSLTGTITNATFSSTTPS